MLFWHLLVLSDFSCYALKRFFQNSPPNRVFNPLSFLFFFIFYTLHWTWDSWLRREPQEHIISLCGTMASFSLTEKLTLHPRTFGSISIVLCCTDQRSYSTLSERIPSDWILSWNCIPCRTTQQHFLCNSLFVMRLRYVYLTLINVYCPVKRF